MKIPKSRAIELINEKISVFEIVKSQVWRDYPNGIKIYQKVYYETVNLLAELFSEGETKKFETDAPEIKSFKDVTGLEKRNLENLVEKCIAQLKAYRDRIQKFWPDDEDETIKKIIIPFVSMSFRDEDSDINNYFTGILNALQIDFETGERYSKESIPEKVKNRIKSSDLLIGILVKRDETINGRFKTPE